MDIAVFFCIFAHDPCIRHLVTRLLGDFAWAWSEKNKREDRSFPISHPPSCVNERVYGVSCTKTT